MGYRHEVRVRYVDCDMQQVVYNAHYLTFVDDTVDCWLRSRWPDFESLGFDVMLKTASVTWHGSARLAERLVIDAAVDRWGTTSFDIDFRGAVDQRRVFDSTVTYVCVDPTGLAPMPVPDELRSFLSA